MQCRGVKLAATVAALHTRTRTRSAGAAAMKARRGDVRSISAAAALSARRRLQTRRDSVL